MSSTTSGTEMPRLVLVGPHVYQLRFVSGLMHEDGTALLGQCLTDQLRIELEEDQPESLLRETVLHELVHAIAAQYSINEDGKEEEEWASALGVGMLAVLRHNPQLTAWIVSKEVKL